MKTKWLKKLFIFFFFSVSCVYADVPPGFEVYFNNPTGTQDANSPGLDFRFKQYVDAASDTEIYAAFYDINNTTVTAALNSALNRGCTVYLIVSSTNSDIPSDVFGFNIPVLQQIKIRYEKASPSGLMHNKFCVLKDSSVWTGSWNTTENCTFKNNNNVVIMRSTSIAKIYENEFNEMFPRPSTTTTAGVFGSHKTLITNNGKTEYINGVKVKIYFSPYSSPMRTNTAIINEIKGNNQITGALEKINFCHFSFSSDDIRESLLFAMQKGVSVCGVLDMTSADNNEEYVDLRAAGAAVSFNTNVKSVTYKLHHKFAVIDPFTAKARVITGSHNWSESANEQNDENTVIIYSTGIAKLFYEEFQRLYSRAGPVTTYSKKAIENVAVYPSPASDRTNIGFELSSSVNSVEITIYNVTGTPIKEILPDFVPGIYNEVVWNCDNDAGEKVASGLYIAKIKAVTPDKTVFKTEKFAVLKGDK